MVNTQQNSESNSSGNSNRSEEHKESDVSHRYENGKIALDYVTKICDTYGERPPGSKEEIEASEGIKKDLEEVCDKTFTERFKIIPGLYPQGLIKLMATSAVIGMAMLPFGNPFPFITLFFIILGFFILFTSLMLMKEWFGLPIFGFKKKSSQNAFGIIYPSSSDGQSQNKAGKKRIIIGGHIDSAFQMKIAKYGDNIAKYTFIAFGYVVFTALIALLKGILLLFVTINAAITVFNNGLIQITYLDIIWLAASLVGFPYLVFIVYCYTGKIKVMGANDNLSGVGVAYALGKHFSQHSNRPKNVELWVGGFGSEECGERGSNYFVKVHGAKGELDNAYAIIPESCGNGSHLAILTGERMHLAKHDPEVYNTLWQAYLDVKSSWDSSKYGDIIPCETAALPFAASDAGRFSLAGYKATSILAYDGELMKPTNWHLTTDTPENLDAKFLEEVFLIVKRYIEIIDEQNSE